ncbi:DUF4258 domain-containing protein [uncultured Thiocystis sp.]|jgi:hypothetical protein|uniref:DUF4258 domain-containing protein n=1 Tax=uncultured Thiocystis sp. TaxID=1202134 RepID=UPI0025F3454B|nr:DUF4258 domain-containing protein [uncultured Thiocystis sp.]
MEIHFSRHAKRRAKLYNLSLSVITEAISESTLQDGQQEILKTIPGMNHPLKIIVSRENDRVTVITNYPLKKRISP